MSLIAQYLEEKKKSQAEELKGDQYKLDKNKNGKLDADDFKQLRQEDQDTDDYKVSKSGRKYKAHRIVFKKGEDDGKLTLGEETDDEHFSRQSPKMQDAINLHLRKGKSYKDAVAAAKMHVKEEVDESTDVTTKDSSGKTVSWKHEGDWKKKTDDHKDKFGNTIKTKNMAKHLAKKGMTGMKEEVETITEEKHRVSVTVSEPDHPAVSKRKEQVQKFVRISANDKASAVKKAQDHYKKQGYRVHGAEHVGMVKEEVEFKVGDHIIWNKGKTAQTAGTVRKVESDHYIIHHARTNSLHKVPKKGSELVEKMDEAMKGHGSEEITELSKGLLRKYLAKSGKVIDKGGKDTDKRIDGYWNASERLSDQKPTSK